MLDVAQLVGAAPVRRGVLALHPGPRRPTSSLLTNTGAWQFHRVVSANA